jgi:hypothetical protein
VAAAKKKAAQGSKAGAEAIGDKGKSKKSSSSKASGRKTATGSRSAALGLLASMETTKSTLAHADA